MSNAEVPANVVVLGAGVIGLSVAHVLSERHPSKYKITIVARDMPEDLSSQAFSSPWAGGNWSPLGEADEKTQRRERVTFNKLWDMISTGLVMKLPSKLSYKDQSDLDNLWYKDLVRDFRVLPPEQVPPGAQAAVTFTTVSFNPEVYLPWLKSELLSRGVEFDRRKVDTLGEAAGMAGNAGILINATGLGARSLLGVEDTNVYPIRGQTILAYAPKVTEFTEPPIGTPVLPDECTYIIPRPSPAGNVILGGTYQENHWDTSIDFGVARRIWDRCATLAPGLKDPEARILRHNVGLRPARTGGARVETEWVQLPLRSDLMPAHPEGMSSDAFPVIHAYGFGPAGYQNSWGVAEEVVDLVSQAFEDRKI